MSMRVLKSAGLVCLGLAFGILVRGLIVSPEPPGKETIVVRSEPQSNQDPNTAESLRVLTAKLELLEGRVAQQGVPATGKPSELGPSAPSFRYDQAEIAQRHEELVRSFAAVRDDFQHEAENPTWSPGQETKIKSQIQERVASKRISVTDSVVECKTTICFATMTWPDFDTAKRELMDADIPDEKCTRRMLLPDESPGPGPFKANLIFECKQ